MDCSHLGLLRFMKTHPPKPGKTLLVGSRVYPGTGDRRKLYADCVGVDMQDGEGVDLVHDMQDPLEGVFSHIDCCSVLEHVKRPWLAAANMESALESGGTILVSVPFVWRVHGYPDDYWRLTASAIPVLFEGIDWKEVAYFGVHGECQRSNSMNVENTVWLERTEVFAFGVKR